MAIPLGGKISQQPLTAYTSWGGLVSHSRLATLNYLNPWLCESLPSLWWKAKGPVLYRFPLGNASCWSWPFKRATAFSHPEDGVPQSSEMEQQAYRREECSDWQWPSWRTSNSIRWNWFLFPPWVPLPGVKGILDRQSFCKLIDANCLCSVKNLFYSPQLFGCEPSL